MESNLNIDVAALNVLHRRALEELMGHSLAANQRLTISIAEAPSTGGQRPSQTLDDWTHVYDGLSDSEIDAIDKIAKARADLPRHWQ